MSKDKPVKVAVIGGGCAAIAAAFELSRPQNQGKYQITIYQLGWRLGGKGASGRGAAGRIEEHGFHVWFGFYENAFRLMRECYAELGRDRTKCRIADWRDAFFPASFVGLAASNADDSLRTFVSYFPSADGLPGDGKADPEFFTIQAYLTRIVSLLRMLLTTAEVGPTGPMGDPWYNRGAGESQPGPASDSTETYLKNAGRLINYGVLMSATGILEALGIAQLLIARTQPGVADTLTRLLEAVATVVRRQVETLVARDGNLLLMWHALDLGIAAVLGVLRHGLLNDPRGFDAINDYDFREWMRLNGACESSLNSPLIRASYDLAFAYEDGDYSRPRHAAGVALRGTLRMLFTYRGAFIWKMSAGMGDLVFAPFYEVLSRRGVRFEFFHRLKRIRLNRKSRADSAGRYVETLDFDVQAKIKGNAEYRPLIELDGLPCWPSGPDYSALVGGRRLQQEGWKFESHWDRRKAGSRSLHVGRDFDFVVLGVGLGAVPHVAAELVESDPRWHGLVTHVKTIETQCFQIWLKQNMAELGWDQPSVSLSAFAHPFETWADMSHLITEERWPAPPGAIAYFCGAHQSDGVPPLTDSGYPARRLEQVRRNAVRFLNEHIVRLWPGAGSKGSGFKWDSLVDPAGLEVEGADAQRFDSQFWIANVDPSERYVLSVPGSQKYRISPLDNTYDNLTVAGDWTACGLDTGCVESAFISGRLAAHAISGHPRIEDITGYDHP